MKVTSIRLPAEVLAKLEWIKIYMQEIAPIKYTNTDIIILAISKYYDELKESNK